MSTKSLLKISNLVYYQMIQNTRIYQPYTNSLTSVSISLWTLTLFLQL